jgi:hypothetical protein
VLKNLSQTSQVVSKCETIIHIPTLSSSKEIKSLVVVFIPSQLTLGHVVERRSDHVCMLHNLPSSMTMAKKIVASSVFH